eukprot:TRINITY_DN762_c6_g1_i1.p1 TRINITY_DN762_c6_g1~~TRINITY_DN762_c6_g1_i1.p1  ORF type:complete len:357 (-),score=70.05 TRINITY_DN762_c6_g1_i1:127-1197(-)
MKFQQIQMSKYRLFGFCLLGLFFAAQGIHVPHLSTSLHDEAVKTYDLHEEVAESELALVEAVWSRLKANNCSGLLCVLLFTCCCGGALTGTLGEKGAAAFNFVVTTGLLFYLLQSGIYAKWWNGKPLELPCRLLSMWAFLLFFLWGALFCLLGMGIGAGLIVKNLTVQQMREMYTEKEKTLTGPRRAYYESDAFKELCNELFDKADQDKDGVLDMKELRGAILETCGSEEVAASTPLFFEAFDNNGDSQVERAEFVEMMKFFSVLRLEVETKHHMRSTKKYYEVLQLRDGAPLTEVRKSYHRLARQWHPDKRLDVSQKIASEDMAEVQEAYDAICHYLKATPEEQKKLKEEGCSQS